MKNGSSIFAKHSPLNPLKYTNICYMIIPNIRSDKKGELHMNYKEKILQLLNKIEDEETLSFIYKIIKRLVG